MLSSDVPGTARLARRWVIVPVLSALSLRLTVWAVTIGCSGQLRRVAAKLRKLEGVGQRTPRTDMRPVVAEFVESRLSRFHLPAQAYSVVGQYRHPLRDPMNAIGGDYALREVPALILVCSGMST